MKMTDGVVVIPNENMYSRIEPFSKCSSREFLTAYYGTEMSVHKKLLDEFCYEIGFDIPEEVNDSSVRLSEYLAKEGFIVGNLILDNKICVLHLPRHITKKQSEYLDKVIDSLGEFHVSVSIPGIKSIDCGKISDIENKKTFYKAYERCKN